jgi:FKBP-type peptidyl-prolyl cis-trans isomerase
MIGKYLKFGILAATVFGMASCLKDVDTDDEKKIVENEAAINKYILDSALTDKVTRESTGLIHYKRTTNPAGELAKTGDAASVRLVGYLLNGTKVLSRTDTLLTFPVDGYTTIGGVELGIKTLRTGEKGSFLIPFYLGFGNSASSLVPAYSPLRLEMEFVKTRTEVQQIDEYIIAKQYTPSERTTDNLVLIRTNTVTGDTLGSGKSVNVKYVGRYLDGTKFDEGTIPHTTNAGGSIPGFDRAVRKMRKTEKAIVIFPSGLGYGKGLSNQGNWVILPYAPLQFELEIL